MKKQLNLLLILLPLTTLAQDQWVIKTKHLHQPDTIWVFKPKSYNPTQQYPLVYLLNTYGENYRQWAGIADVQQLADNYQMLFVCPTGGISWYLNSPLDVGSQMETFFFKDLVVTVEQQLTVDKRNIFITGSSMGAYGALRLFLLHPDYFNSAAASSGSMEIDPVLIANASRFFYQDDRIAQAMTRLIGQPAETNWHQYSITSLLKEVRENKKPFLFDCGRNDFFYGVNQRLRTVCDELGVPATFTVQPGDHNPEYWRQSIQQHLFYFKNHLVKQ